MNSTPSAPISTTTHDHDHDSNPAMKLPTNIPINAQRASTLISNLSHVQSRIAAAVSSLPESSPSPDTPVNVQDPHHSRTRRPPRLVAVSKLKPASDILALHNPPTSQAHFGENYVQELSEKSRLLPPTIRWHFIGGLQSNKAAQLARDVDGLWAVESVDSEKKAMLLDRGRRERDERRRATQQKGGQGGEQRETDTDGTVDTDADADVHPDPLRVFIQVNTSGEESKSGISPSSPALVSLARFIRSSACPTLHLQGLMTIGAIARSRATTAETENDDFICLRETRDRLAQDLGLPDPADLELSMGMSEDFEGAIRLGSGEVRVGSTIFGERPAKSEAKVLEDTAAQGKNER